MEVFTSLFQSVGKLFSLILKPFVLLSLNLLMFCYLIFTTLHFPSPLAFSIIGLTVIIRLILYPLFSRQIRFSKKTMELAPQVAKLKEKHKNDTKTFYAAQQSLYKEHGISQQVGCLATIAQLPVLIALYQVLNGIFFVNGRHPASSLQQIHHINSNVLPFLQIHAPLNTDFFNWSLASVPSHSFHAQPLIILVPILTGLFSFIQTKMMSPTPVDIYKSDSSKELKEKQEKGDMASQMQGQMLILAPLMIGFFSFGFPIGLSLYWNTSTIFGIIQQYKIGGWGGMNGIWQRAQRH